VPAEDFLMKIGFIGGTTS